MSEVSGLITQFVNDPSFKQHGFLSLSLHLKESAALLPEAEATARLVDELEAAASRVKELKEQVDQF